MSEITFKITPQIERYVNEIVNYWNDCREHMPVSHIKFHTPLAFYTYMKHEDRSAEAETNRLNFMEWLEKKCAVEIKNKNIDTGHQISDDDYAVYEIVTELHVVDIKPLLQLTESKVTLTDNGRLIFFDSLNSRFLYGKRRSAISIDTSKGYGEVMVAIYESGGEDGETDVAKINDILKARYNYSKKLDFEQIRGHINASIRKKLKEMDKKSEHNFFTWKRGLEVLDFNNPKF